MSRVVRGGFQTGNSMWISGSSRATKREAAWDLIVGGYAVMKYTEPFSTKDIDIWVDPTGETPHEPTMPLSQSGSFHARKGVRRRYPTS